MIVAQRLVRHVCDDCVLKGLTRKPRQSKFIGNLISLENKHKASFSEGVFSIELIKKHCLQCQDGNAEGVKNCHIEECTLWYFRRRSQPLSEKEVKRLVGKYCLMCQYHYPDAVVNCVESNRNLGREKYPEYGETCVLYPYRIEGLMETEAGKRWKEEQKLKELYSEDSNKESNEKSNGEPSEIIGEVSGELLKQAREKKGWTQVKLATYLSTSKQFISKMERGKRPLTPKAKEFTERIISGKGLYKGKEAKERDGESLVEARKERKLSQKQLASLLGITQQYISFMEKDKKPLILEAEKFIEEAHETRGF